MPGSLGERNVTVVRPSECAVVSFCRACRTFLSLRQVETWVKDAGTVEPANDNNNNDNECGRELYPLAEEVSALTFIALPIFPRLFTVQGAMYER